MFEVGSLDEFANRQLHLYDLATGATTDTGARGQLLAGFTDWLVVAVFEPGGGDGDVPIHVHNVSTSETIDLGLRGHTNSEVYPRMYGDWLLLRAYDDGGELSQVLVDLRPVAGSRSFLRGDCNDDDAVDISDASCILNWLFLGTAAPGCVAATNTNGDVSADISDATYLLNHLFLGGPLPRRPIRRVARAIWRATHGSVVRLRRTAAERASFFLELPRGRVDGLSSSIGAPQRTEQRPSSRELRRVSFTPLRRGSPPADSGAAHYRARSRSAPSP